MLYLSKILFNLLLNEGTRLMLHQVKRSQRITNLYGVMLKRMLDGHKTDFFQGEGRWFS